MSRVTMTLPEAKTWLLYIAVACVNEGHVAGETWTLEGLRVVGRGRSMRTAVVERFDDAADHNRRFGTRESKRDARIQCLIASILRAVEPS